MNNELYKSPDSLSRLRVEVITKATDWANNVIDNSFSKTVPSTFNSYSPAEDLNHANQQSEKSLAHFKQITDATLNDTNTPQIIEPAHSSVYDINTLRQSVNQAYSGEIKTETPPIIKEEPPVTNTPNYEKLQNAVNSAYQFPIPDDRME